MSETPVYNLLTSQSRQTVRELLGQMADRLETSRPDEDFTDVGRIALIQATTMSPSLAGPLRELAPSITQPMARRDYAALLRAAITGAEAKQ